jgi:hypothetical protein
MVAVGHEMNRSDLEALLADHIKAFRLEGGGHELVLKREDLRGIDLSGADLAGVVLSEVRLDGANLTDADLYATFAGGSSFVGADLSRAHIESRLCRCRRSQRKIHRRQPHADRFLGSRPPWGQLRP